MSEVESVYVVAVGVVAGTHLLIPVTSDDKTLAENLTKVREEEEKGRRELVNNIN